LAGRAFARVGTRDEISRVAIGL